MPHSSFKHTMSTLSVIIITKNESNRIEACLQSVAWADEIIVLDSGSSDDTVLKARRYTQKIDVTDWPGFGLQKNRALQKASCHWVLSIDADEQVSEQLRDEILSVMKSGTSSSAYSMRRLSSYLGKILQHGDWKNDTCVRLFLRDKAHFSDDIIHEKLLVLDGKIGELKHPLYHRTFTSVEQIIEKINAYSTLTAQSKLKKGQQANLLKAITHSVWTFVRGYLLRKGFLDGKEGFLLAVSNAQGTFYRYVKMMQANRHER